MPRTQNYGQARIGHHIGESGLVGIATTSFVAFGANRFRLRSRQTIELPNTPMTKPCLPTIAFIAHQPLPTILVNEMG
jgi:hypothetical protein